MGLDMYMFRIDKETALPEYPNVRQGMFEPTSDEDKEILNTYWEATEQINFIDVAYWRKFNALHAWFVDECQDGIDECQYSEVTEEKLKELIELVDKSIKKKKPLLEPRGGFFFGSTDTDEYYWEDMKELQKELKRITEEVDFDDDKLIYSSSW
jgi:hypothetical protein